MGLHGYILVRSDIAAGLHEKKAINERSTFLNVPTAAGDREIKFNQITPGNYRMIATVAEKPANGFVRLPAPVFQLNKDSVPAVDLPPLFKVKFQLDAKQRITETGAGGRLEIHVHNKTGYQNYIPISIRGDDYVGEWDYVMVSQSYELELRGSGYVTFPDKTVRQLPISLGIVKVTAADVLRANIEVNLPGK